MNYLKILFDRFRSWRLEHVSQQHFVLYISLLVGLLSGLAAVILKNTIQWVKVVLVGHFESLNFNILYLAYPAIGILLTLLFVRFFVKDSLGHGITKILYAISRGDSRLKRHNNYSSIVASSLTIGFGGSVGAEAPIVLTGASLGSTIGRFFNLDYKTLTLMMACGAAGGIAGVFKAPIAGMVFTVEILMLNLTMASLLPLLISTVTATSVAFFFLGKEAEFNFVVEMPFAISHIPHYLLLGVFTGFISLYFMRGLMMVEKKFAGFKHSYNRLIVGGIVLGVLIFFFPPLYGEGYSTIASLLRGQENEVFRNTLFNELGNGVWMMILYLGFIVIFKVFATGATNGAGGVGGAFAPSLFLGGVSGFLFARLVNLTGWVAIPEVSFTLAGMAGIMSGVMHAPLTAIFLIAEISNGYQLIIPLIITATIAYITIYYFEPYSIYTKRLADEGKLITHEKDKAVLTLMKLDDVVETDFHSVSSTANLGELVQVVSHSKRNIFPVLNSRGEMQGIILLEDIRKIMFDSSRYNKVTVASLMTLPPDIIHIHDTMEAVMEKFEATGAWNLPVVDDSKKYVGFVSKSKIFSVYRNVLIDFSYE
jgi:CIC family chloride channel protein